MQRTTNKKFKKCLICGKRPYVEIYNVNDGCVYCKGNLLKKHTLIKVNSNFCEASSLYQTLLQKWNSNN